MLYDGLTLAEGTAVANMTIASGTTNPTNPSTGELFYRTDSPNEGLYVYTGTAWTAVGSTASFDSLNVKPAVRAATTANITLSGTQTIDGVSLAVGQRVLVKNQNTGSQNGIYVVASGSWTRATDFDGSPSTEVTAGDFVFVQEGTTYADTGWVLTTNGTITIGTTALTFAQFSSTSSVSLTSTYVGYGSAGNLLTGSANFAWNDATQLLYVGGTAYGTSTISGAEGSGNLVIKGGKSGGSVPGGHLYIQGGNSLRESDGGSNNGPNLYLRSGTGGGDIPASGAIVFQTGATQASYTERMRMLGSGALSFGTSGTAYGTSGQVLTSNGDAPPSWQSVSLSSFTTITGSNSGSANTITTVAVNQGAGSNTLVISTGDNSGGPGAQLSIIAGASLASGQAGGDVLIRGGTGAGGSSTTGGTVYIRGGIAGTTGGSIIFSTAPSNTDAERLRITSSGAWGLGGANYGTSGQVLTSNGSGSAPTWQTAAGGSFTGGTVANATTFSSSVSFNALYTETNVSVTASSSTTLDCSLGNNFAINLAASITTLTLSNVPVSGRVYSMTLVLKQDATGGKTINWPASVKWPGGSAPALTTTGDKYDIVSLMTNDGGTIWFGFVAGQNF